MVLLLWGLSPSFWDVLACPFRKSFCDHRHYSVVFAVVVFALLMYVGFKIESTNPAQSISRMTCYMNTTTSILLLKTKSYLEVEKFWKKVHLKAMADQKMLGWSLCE